MVVIYFATHMRSLDGIQHALLLSKVQLPFGEQFVLFWEEKDGTVPPSSISLVDVAGNTMMDAQPIIAERFGQRARVIQEMPPSIVQEQFPEIFQGSFFNLLAKEALEDGVVP